MIPAMRHLIAAALMSLVTAQSLAAQTPPPAADVVAAAVKRAQAENKSVLIEFGASWCTWCRNFEAFVRSPDAGPILAKNFVVVNLPNLGRTPAVLHNTSYQPPAITPTRRGACASAGSSPSSRLGTTPSSSASSTAQGAR